MDQSTDIFPMHVFYILVLISVYEVMQLPSKQKGVSQSPARFFPGLSDPPTKYVCISVCLFACLSVMRLSHYTFVCLSLHVGLYMAVRDRCTNTNILTLAPTLLLVKN